MLRTLSKPILFAITLAISTGPVSADPISAELATQIEAYKAKLTKWAAEPAVIATAKVASEHGALAGMNNATWESLKDNDGAVEGFRQTPASAHIREWEKDPHISKIFLRDKAGNLAAAGIKKPFIYNVVNRPPFKNAVTGNAWADNQLKKDPSTEEMVVQISVPVKDGEQVVGVLHTAIK